MPNIKQIAAAAGVSVSTVSRVLNNHPYVKQDKREAVEEAINRLQYSRNMNAVHLIKGTTQMIGVILPHINHSYFSHLISGIAQEALKQNYQLMICQTNYQPEEELKALDMLRNKQIDGLIICSRSLSLEQIESYTGFGPIVLCEDVAEKQLSSVYFDHYTCFQSAISYLWKMGYRHIGYTINRRDGPSSDLREKAYYDTLQALGGQARNEWIFEGCRAIEHGEEVVGRLLKMDQRPDALLVTGDQVAAGFVISARNYGLRVPEDLAIIGFDNQPISKVLGITTIDTGLSENGARAFKIVYDQIIGLSKKTITQIVEFHLIERNTVGREKN